jgi:hypothetical protein
MEVAIALLLGCLLGEVLYRAALRIRRGR